jgi:DNA-binding transcriptional regulator PaaX
MSQRSVRRMPRPSTQSSSHSPYGRGALAREILLMMAAGVAIPAALLMPGIPRALRPLLKSLSEKCGAKRSEGFIKSLSYLQKNRLVSIAEKDGQQVVTLSEDGRRRVMNYNLDQMTIKEPKTWDGYWRIVIFDIPERKKLGREAFRSKLKQLGFFQLQKSCFIYPFDCKSEIDFISELFEVSPYVNYIVAKEIEGATLLQKFFRLPY